MLLAQVLSTGQAAKRLGVSVRTLYRLEAIGRLGPVTPFARRANLGHRRTPPGGAVRAHAANQPAIRLQARVVAELGPKGIIARRHCGQRDPVAPRTVHSIGTSVLKVTATSGEHALATAARCRWIRVKHSVRNANHS